MSTPADSSLANTVRRSTSKETAAASEGNQEAQLIARCSDGTLPFYSSVSN